MYGAGIGLFDQTQKHDMDVPKYIEEDTSREHVKNTEDALNHSDVDPNLAVEEKEGWHGYEHLKQCEPG